MEVMQALHTTTVYVFGNPYLEEDNLAYRVAKHLENTEGVTLFRCRSPDSLLDHHEGPLVILDVVKDTDQPVRITNIKQLKTRSMVSLHDFDLGFFLHLLQEMGLLDEVTIIGIPQHGNPEQLAAQVKAWL